MSERFEHDGIRFAFDSIGVGAPVVLLHGLGGDRAGALELADEEQGWLRIAMDQRGHGETEPVGPESAYTFDVFASDVEALLDAAGIDRAVLVGVSMGAAVALRLALRSQERVRGLVLVRPAWIHEPMTDNLTPNVEVARLLRSMPAEGALTEFQGSALYARLQAVSPHAADSLSSQFVRPMAAERAVRLDRMPRSTPYADPSDLQAIACPTLVVGCDRDPFHPFAFAETWSRLIPGAALQLVIPSADDVARHRREVRAVVGGFLRQFELLRSWMPEPSTGGGDA